MKTKHLASAAALLLASAAAFAANQACSLTAVVPQQGRFQLGKSEVSVGEPDLSDQPTAWQGPLQSEHCTFDIGIIEQPIAITPAGLLFVSTYSGSTRAIALYDLNSCSVRWHSETFEGKLELTSNALRMGDKTTALNNSCVPVNSRTAGSLRAEARAAGPLGRR